MKKFIFITLSLLATSLCSASTFEPKFIWLSDVDELKIFFKGDAPKENEFKKNFKITDSKKRDIDIEEYKSLGEAVTIKIDTPIKVHENVALNQNGMEFFAIPTNDYLNRYAYFKGRLGSYKSGNTQWTFTLWSPTARDVAIKIYADRNKLKPIISRRLLPLENGAWSISIDYEKLKLIDLENTFYEYIVHSNGRTYHAVDPYALSLTPFNKFKPHEVLAQIIDLHKILDETKNLTFKNNKDILNGRKFFGYEAHVRDLTIKQLKKNSGTYQAATNAISHLQDLGITHVQFMPVSFYQTVNELDRSFQNNMQDLKSVNYNWGYDVQHFFALSGYLATDPRNPRDRMIEYLNTVSSFHNANIGIVMDVVFNHVWNGVLFENAAPGCYLRRTSSGDYSNGSGAGYTFDSEKFMARRMIIDSLEWFTKFYHVNGFRFDLMSFIDVTTMRQIKERLGDDVILYGEGWNLTDLPDKSQATIMHQLPFNTLGAFNDRSRDGIIGGIDDPGVVMGNAHKIPEVKSVVLGALKGSSKYFKGVSADPFHAFTESPNQSMNYLDIHDGPTLWDKVDNLLVGPEEMRLERIKQAYQLLFTSYGSIIMQGGSEFGRTKITTKNDPDKYSVFKSKNYPGRLLQHNSYHHSDDVNGIDYRALNTKKDLTNFISSLNQLRNHLPHFNYDRNEIIKNVKFLNDHDVPEIIEHKIYNSFDELDDLTIKFINGPKSEAMYMAGEIHVGDNKNPEMNRFRIQFDELGNGEIKIVSNDFENIDLESWSNPDALNFKLVSKPGSWETIPGAYSGMGNNAVVISSIPESKIVTIDLSHMDSSTNIDGNFKATNVIAYSIYHRDGTLYAIHNFTDETYALSVDDNLKNSKVLMDSKSALATGIKSSDVVIDNKTIKVKPHKSVLIMN